MDDNKIKKILEGFIRDNDNKGKDYTAGDVMGAANVKDQIDHSPGN